MYEHSRFTDPQPIWPRFLKDSSRRLEGSPSLFPCPNNDALGLISRSISYCSFYPWVGIFRILLPDWDLSLLYYTVLYLLEYRHYYRGGKPMEHTLIHPIQIYYVIDIVVQVRFRLRLGIPFFHPPFPTPRKILYRDPLQIGSGGRRCRNCNVLRSCIGKSSKYGTVRAQLAYPFASYLSHTIH